MITIRNKVLKEASTICHNAGYISDEANSLIYLGFSSIEQNNIELAKSYYKQAKPLALKSGNKVLLGNLADLEQRINSYNK